MADSNPVPSERGRVGITIRSNENSVPAAALVSACAEHADAAVLRDKQDDHDIRHRCHNHPRLIHKVLQQNSTHCHSLPMCWDCILGFQLKLEQTVTTIIRFEINP